MSGGSFNYLCYADAERLPERLEALERMAQALRKYPEGHLAASGTKAIANQVEDFFRRIEPQLVELRPVWKAVEWHHSCDWGEERVVEALNKMGQDTEQSDEPEEQIRCDG